MHILNKKKKINEDQLIDSLTDNPDISKKIKTSKKINSEAQFEKVNAQIDALKEILHAQQERFERYGEEIGELRSILADREKQIHSLESKAVHASELVESVQPENFMSEQKKMDARIESLRGKMDNNGIVSKTIIDELKSIKNKIAVFRGTDEILKLNDEVRDELTSIKKVESKVERHADRVEAIFTSIESNFKESQKQRSDLSTLSDVCNNLSKTVTKNEVSINSLPKKEELYDLKKEVNKSLESIGTEKSVYSRRNTELELSIKGLSKQNRSLSSRFDKIKSDDLKSKHIKNSIKELIDQQTSSVTRLGGLEDKYSETINLKQSIDDITGKQTSLVTRLDTLEDKNQENKHLKKSINELTDQQIFLIARLDVLEDKNQENKRLKKSIKELTNQQTSLITRLDTLEHKNQENKHLNKSIKELTNQQTSLVARLDDLKDKNKENKHLNKSIKRLTDQQSSLMTHIGALEDKDKETRHMIDSIMSLVEKIIKSDLPKTKRA